jgi:hypothetical protein
MTCSILASTVHGSLVVVLAGSDIAVTSMLGL